MKISARLLLIITMLATPYPSLGDEAIDYPSNYRTWTHVKTALITQSHPLFETFGGIHHVYANDTALRALKGQTEFPEGSVLVFDLFVAELVDGVIGEGPRRRLDVMQKSSVKFSSTDNWGYGSFRESTRQLIFQDIVQKCVGCHATQEGTDFVFSRFRD